MEPEFDWLSLEDGEEVIWSGRPKMNSIYPSLAFGVLLIPVFGLGLLIILASYLYIQNTHFIVSSEGVYKKTGIVSRRVKNIGFNKIQDISFSQGVFGNYFDYGNVEISTAGGQNVEMRFNSVEDPKKVQELINKRIRSKKKNKPVSEEQSVDRQILTELSKIRESLEEIKNKI